MTPKTSFVEAPADRKVRRQYSAVVLLVNLLFALQLIHIKWLPIHLPVGLRWVAVAGMMVFLALASRRWWNLRIDVYAGCFGAFVAAAILSTLLRGEDLADGAQRCLGFLAVYLTAFVLNQAVNRVVVVRVWTSALYYVSVVACFFSAAVLTRPDAYNQGRFFGVFQTPNFLGNAAAITTLLSLVRIGEARGLKRWLCFFVIPVSGYCLYASNSRTNLWTVVFLVTCTPLYFGARRTVAIATIAAGLLASGLLELTFNVAPVKLVRRELRSADRADVWSTQWAVFASSPLIGYGLAGGNHQVDFESPLTAGRAGGEGSYLDLLTVAGITGCLPLFVALGFGVRRLGLWTLRDRKERWLGEACFVTLLILIVSLADGWLATAGTLTQYVWVVIAAATRSIRSRSPRHTTPVTSTLTLATRVSHPHAP